MTTTANLSVGINTASAKESLRELKLWLAASMRDVAVSIDPSSIDRQLQGYFKQRTFKFKTDKQSLAGIAREIENEVGVGLAKAFHGKENRVLRYNSEQLRASVQASIGVGFAQRDRKLLFDREGLKRSVQSALAEAFATPHTLKVTATPVAAVGAAAGVAAGAVPDVAMARIAQTIISSLTPAVDELSKASALVGGVARQAGLRGGGRVSASRTVSAKDAETGVSTTARATVKDPDAALAEIAAQQRKNDLLKEEEWLRKAASNASVVAAKQEAAAAAARQAAFDRHERAQAAQAASAKARAFAQAEAARAASDTGSRKNLESEHNVALKQAIRQRIADMKGSANQIQVMEERAQLERRSREKAHFAALRAQRLQAQAQEAAEAKAHAAQIARYFNNAKAASSLTGKGASIQAALATQGKFGTPATEKFLGNRAYLLDQAGSLGKYTAAVASASKAHDVLTSSMREGHSAARGMLGALGQMWMTWGSIMPLLAGAAVGATLRSVFTVGKDLEYQLKFVQVLAEGASVSLDGFRDAIKGSMVLPTEAAGALRGLAQNGLSAKEALMALPDILALATAGEMELNEAALGATGVMASFNLQVTDLGRVGDVFAKAAAMSNTSVSSMVESMKQASTVSDAYNVSLEETAASLAVLAKRNILGTAAGTAFRNMMGDLAAPTEKAKRAMQDIGLKLYTSEGQIKSFTEVMADLKQKTISLNEESRNRLLGDLFDERGMKAASALLSDFGLLERTLKTLQTEAKGFTREVVEALGDTTQGKVKKLMAEFQLTTMDAFNNSAGAVKSFVDSLRLVVRSDEFVQFVSTVSSAVISLTKYLVENAAAIKTLVLGFVAMKVAAGSLSILVQLAQWMHKVAAGTVAMNAALAPVLGLVTGGAALVGLLVAQYIMLRDRSNEVTTALKEQGDSLGLQTSEMERNVRSSESVLEHLKEQIKLMREGREATDAQTEATMRLSRAQVEQALQATNRQLLDTTDKLQTNPAYIRSAKGMSEEDRHRAQSKEVREQVKQQKQLLANRDFYLQQLALIDRDAARRQEADEHSARVAAMKHAQAFNKRVQELTKDEKLKKAGVKFSEVSLDAPKEEVDRRLAEMNETLGKHNTYKGQSTGAHAVATANLQETMSRVQQSETRLKQEIKLRKELADARFKGMKLGPELDALLAEDRARDERVALMEAEKKVISELQRAKSIPGLQEADQKRIDNEIAQRRFNLDLMGDELTARAAIARVIADSDLEAMKDKPRLRLRELSTQGDEDRRKLQQKYELKVTDPVNAAAFEASAATLARYAQDIASTEETIAILKDRMLKLSQEEQTAARVYLDIQEQVLEALKAQAAVESKKSGETAKGLEAHARSAQGGMDKFWAEYTRNAESASDQVYKAMKGTYSALEDMVAKFVTTGKLSFKDFGRAILAEMTKIVASNIARSLMKLIGGGKDGKGGLVGAITGLFGGGVSSANGNIVTSEGALPLRRFANGGIANSPTLSLFGEGRQPEAYVPLPDGRTIPVTMEGGGGGSVVKVNYAPVIQIDSRTDQAQVDQIVQARINASQRQLVQQLRDMGALA